MRFRIFTVIESATLETDMTGAFAQLRKTAGNDSILWVRGASRNSIVVSVDCDTDEQCAMYILRDVGSFVEAYCTRPTRVIYQFGETTGNSEELIAWFGSTEERRIRARTDYLREKIVDALKDLPIEDVLQVLSK